MSNAAERSVDGPAPVAPLHVVGSGPAIDLDAAESAVRALLEALGQGPDTEVLEADHLCMSLRGVEATGSRTVTSSLHGLIRDDARTRAEFLDLTGIRG